MPDGLGEQFYLAALSSGYWWDMEWSVFHKYHKPIVFTVKVVLTKSLFYTKSLGK